jgi:hypothetical protein
MATASETVQNVLALRIQLERDLLALLQRFASDTGFTPTSVDLQTTDVSRFGPITDGRVVVLTGVRVTVGI